MNDPSTDGPSTSNALLLFLRGALAAADSLAKLHQSGIIHQNIRPDTLRIDPAGTHVELTGAASNHAQDPAATTLPVESLPYIAPEQTGRFDGSIDHRVDLYSLGIVLYERWANTLPFHAKDALGWVHCHVARSPRPLKEAVPATPAVVSDIIMKLLAKSPDDRYQSARGLGLDLGRCMSEAAARGTIEPFALGTRDVWDKLRASSRVYGREKELAALREALGAASRSHETGVIVITGPAGMGKTALMHELQRGVGENAFVLFGKFEQGKRDIPYVTIGHAFRDLVRQLLAMPDAELEPIRQRLLAALGVNAQLVAELVPQIELIIGKQPPPMALPAAEAQIRFTTTFASFLRLMATSARPIKLFLDDLQWADPGSLDLLQHVLTQPGLRGVTLVGTYRDEEGDAPHPLEAFLSAARSAGRNVTRIEVGALGQTHVCDLVMDLFGCERAEAEPLATLLFAKTGGNPFFAAQLLGTLHQEQLIRFDPRQWAWRWDVAEIEAKAITDDLVELVLDKLRRLPAKTLETLKLAACISLEIRIDLLASLSSETPDAIRAALEPAIAEGILVQRSTGLVFLHERLVQAAYSLVPEDEQAALHLELGRLLLQSTPELELEGSLFDITNHCNLGAAHVSTNEERRRIAELDLRAGRKAKAAAAAKTGAMYLATGVSLLPPDAFRVEHALAQALHLELAECEFLNGRFEEVERLCALLIEHAESAVESAAAYRIRIQLATAQVDSPRAVEAGLTCLRLLGVELPTNPTDEDVLAEVALIHAKLEGKPIESLIDLPAMKDPAMVATLELLSAIRPPALYVAPNLAHLAIARIVRLSIEHGNAPASVHGYATLGAILCSRLARFQEGYRFGKLAWELGSRPGFESYSVEAVTDFGLIIPFSRHAREMLDYLRIAFKAGRDSGKPLYASSGAVQIAITQLEIGASLDVVEEAAVAALDYATSVRLGFVADAAICVRRFALSMRGSTARLGALSGEGFDEAAFGTHLRERSIPALQLWYAIYRAGARYIARDWEGAFAAVKEAEGLLWSGMYTLLEAQYDYYGALAAAATYATVDEAGRADLRGRLTQHELKLARWAESCPDNFAGKHALVSAEIARLDGREHEATRLYDKAVRSARENGFVQDEAIACEVAGRFFLERGYAILPGAYLRQARSTFERWGALAKVSQLEAIHGELLAEQRRESGAPAPEAGTGQIDTISAAKASEAISSEMSPEKLLATLMRIVIEHAGAQRSCLLLPAQDHLDVAAEVVAGHDGTRVEIPRGGRAPAAEDVPLSIANYVRRTREKLILDDASAHAMFSADPYIARVNPRSLLCAPILRRGEVAGILYLENRLVRGAFTPRRLALLEFLSAVSLENALLAQDLERETAERALAEKTLQQSEARLERLVETANVVPWEADRATGRFTYVGPQAVGMLGYPQDAWYVDQFFASRVNVEDREAALIHLVAPSDDDGFDFRVTAADGRTVWLHNVLSVRGGAESDVVGGFLFDVTERREAEITLREKLRIIETQQASIQRLSTPIIEVWDGVLTMPVLGVVDGNRATQMMDVILQAVTRSGARYMILDLTGVDTVDTMSADHIMKIVRAVQLLGAKSIVVGIRPEVAQTVVSMGVDLSTIITLATLRSALLLCMKEDPKARGARL